MGRVVKFHVKSLEKLHRESAGRRWNRVELVVTDHAHRAFLIRVCELAQVAADARIVPGKFQFP